MNCWREKKDKVLILFEKHWRQRETVATYTMKINRSSLGNVQDSHSFQ